jgi:hypothetical protein
VGQHAVGEAGDRADVAAGEGEDEQADRLEGPGEALGQLALDL